MSSLDEQNIFNIRNLISTIIFTNYRIIIFLWENNKILSINE